MALTDGQRAVIASGLRAAKEFGFALAGSGALIAHGISNRKTDDTDWFSTVEHEGSFEAAVEAVTSQLKRDGFSLTALKRDDTFFRFAATMPAGEVVEVDMSLDWRRYNPAEIAIGTVLDIQDAAAAKVATIFSRGEVRDFIDLWSIRATRLWTDNELFAMARDRDEGIDVEMFTVMLKEIDKYDDGRFAYYSLVPAEIADVRAAAIGFAGSITAADVTEFVVPDHTGDVHVRSHPRAGSDVVHYWRSRPIRRA